MVWRSRSAHGKYMLYAIESFSIFENMIYQKNEKKSMQTPFRHFVAETTDCSLYKDR